MTADDRPPGWWHALDAHRQIEAEARHRTAEKAAEDTAAVAARVDRIESMLDQWRGAQGLVKALIGTNILVAVATIIALVAAVR